MRVTDHIIIARCLVIPVIVQLAVIVVAAASEADEADVFMRVCVAFGIGAADAPELHAGKGAVLHRAEAVKHPIRDKPDAGRERQRRQMLLAGGQVGIVAGEQELGDAGRAVLQLQRRVFGHGAAVFFALLRVNRTVTHVQVGDISGVDDAGERAVFPCVFVGFFKDRLGEGVCADLDHAGDVQRLETAALIERAVSELGDRLGKLERDDVVAAGEGIVTDLLHVLEVDLNRELNVRSNAVEHIVRDALQIFRQNHRPQLGAAAERAVAGKTVAVLYGGDAL